jgi:Uma2 family endonuclease
MATSLICDETIEVPVPIGSLADFRRWALSDSFPERGRIDFIRNKIEIDMSAEELFTHGTPKAEIGATLYQRARRMKLGRVFVDRTRISNVEADLSAEPDVVFVSRESLESGRVRLVPKASGGEERFIEMEGSPDLIVEVVSDSSATKDSQRLPAACYDAGVCEYWLVDARRKNRFVFQIHHRRRRKFEPAKADAHGFQKSGVFECWFRLDRFVGDDGHWEFDLRSQEISRRKSSTPKRKRSDGAT